MQKLDCILRKFIWIPYLIILLATVQTAIWAADRKPPFIIESGAIIPPTHAGAPMKIEGKVKRDLSRNCDLLVHHWAEDNKGYRYYFPDVKLGHESIVKLEEISPGYTKYTADLPRGMPEGKAIYHSESIYTCNPFHKLVLPITVVFRVPFEVEKEQK